MEHKAASHAHLAEIVASYNASMLPSQLMAKPVLSWGEFWYGLLSLSDQAAKKIYREGHPPKFFLIGGRRFILTADAIDWLNRTAKSSPYVPERRGRRAACAGKETSDEI